MKTWKSNIENLKCGGCENTVKSVLLAYKEVAHAHADAMTGEVEVEYRGEEEMADTFSEALRKAGYPPTGESTLRDKAVSYISCMKGRMHKD